MHPVHPNLRDDRAETDKVRMAQAIPGWVARMGPRRSYAISGDRPDFDLKLPATARGTRYLAHAFGRFRIASFGALDLAILVRHVDSPVYAMRLNQGSSD